jgi:non-heme chloroperoxidase
MHKLSCLLRTIVLITLVPSAQSAQAATSGGAPPQVQMVPVGDHVQLEVLDWGGTGKALIFLAGLNRTAHDFETFAPRFVPQYHVYAITRRGNGASSKPDPTPANYSAHRLGDDVLAVITGLKIKRPFLAGHSIAGEELSSIGSRKPNAVAGLIYLDASSSPAFYDEALGNFGVENSELLRRIGEISVPTTREQDMSRIQALLDSHLLERYIQTLRSVHKQLGMQPPTPANAQAPVPNPYWGAIHSGQEIFKHIDAPVLAIVAMPHDYMRKPDPRWKANYAIDLAYQERQTEDFRKAIKSARVVILPYASHDVFMSNADEVEREMKSFMALH